MYEDGLTNMKIGAIYSGISYQYGVFNSKEYREKIEKLFVCDLTKIDFLSYDALIFPRGTDQEMVYNIRHKIREFLDLKKIVVSLGEVTKNWLPSCKWDGVKPEDDEALLIKVKHPLLENIEADGLHWHKGSTGWCCHGHFIAPPGAEVLVTNSLGDPVMYIDRQSTKGIILAASQLDAVCHMFHNIEGAKGLFNNILNWVAKEAIKLKEVNKNG